MNTSSIYRTWQQRLDSGVLTRGQIGQWCQAIEPLAAGFKPNGKRTNLTGPEARALVEKLADSNGIGITREQTEFGQQWLSRYGERSGMRTGPVQAFRFMGGYRLDDGTWYRAPAYCAVYRTFMEDGHVFDYVAAPWQRGGGVEWWPVTRGVTR